jgi:hypothetical protein
VYICASCLWAGYVPSFCLVRHSSFTCSHLLPPSSHRFLFVFDNLNHAAFIKFCIMQVALWFACLSCHLGSTMILYMPLVFFRVCSFWTFCVSVIWNEPLVFLRLRSLRKVLCFHDFKWAPGIFGGSFLLEHFTLMQFHKSPWYFWGLVPSGTFYASVILNEPLVFSRLRSFQNVLCFCNFKWASGILESSFLLECFMLPRFWASGVSLSLICPQP